VKLNRNINACSASMLCQERVTMTTAKLFGGILLAIAAGLAPQLAAQLQTDVPPPVAGAKPVTVEHIRAHGVALEGNLEGDAVDRDVFVFLPPSYAQETSRRYPVIYALHGFSIGAEQWTHEIHVPQTIEGAFAQGAKEMIVVLPDSKTLHNGSMYSSSVTTGDFERFIARDLVSYIDAHYRTIPDRQSRGLVGHSMGGYGATRIGMKHSDVFGSLYIMSPCCLSPRPAVSPELAKSLEPVKTPADSASLPFFARATLASAAAWSPNPRNPPLYLDLATKEGVPQPDILAKVQLLCNQECDGFLVLAFFSFQVFRYDLFTHSEAAMSPELNKTRPQILRRLAASICARH
jgi:pimeloyl-ACP methyl ester carboxylesterase